MIGGLWDSKFVSPVFITVFQNVESVKLIIIQIYANLAILATPGCFIGHQVYVLDPRWLSSLLDKLDISC